MQWNQIWLLNPNYITLLGPFTATEISLVTFSKSSFNAKQISFGWLGGLLSKWVYERMERSHVESLTNNLLSIMLRANNLSSAFGRCVEKCDDV